MKAPLQWATSSGGARGGLRPPERKLSPPCKFSKAYETRFNIGVTSGVGWTEPTREEIPGAAFGNQVDMKLYFPTFKYWNEYVYG